MFPHVFLLSTAGMASGLSLGPEMPLVLTSGMVGSVIAIMCKQSIQRARVLNLTAASAAIGGFFGFLKKKERLYYFQSPKFKLFDVYIIDCEVDICR